MEAIRKAFETVCVPNFTISDRIDFSRNARGEYTNPLFEDHWQTFQEGWEEAVKYLQNRKNSDYTDIISTGEMDPR